MKVIGVALRLPGVEVNLTKNRDRRFLATFLREAMAQALDNDKSWDGCWDELKAIADNLHSPLPPPTLAQARAADLETQEGIETVRAFLAALGEGEQP
jgi:hypothetical protein